MSTQAFPESGGQSGPYGGMTLRDYFAAKAMQSLIQITNRTKAGIQDRVAVSAYRQADAMLKAREE